MRKFAVALVAAIAVVPCLRSATVYSNGAINGTKEAYGISAHPVVAPDNSVFVSDSFTIATGATIRSGELGLWIKPGSTILSLSWAIGTTPYGSEISSGNSALSNTLYNSSSRSSAVYDSTFTLSGVLPSAGTYYLTLFNAASDTGEAVYWDENDGPSTGSQRVDTNGTPGTPYAVGSEAFTLFDTSAPAPEPSTWALLGLGAVGAGVAALRRRRTWV